MQKEIENKLDALKNICTRYGVRRLYLFGSATRQDFNTNSDIDFLISFDESLSIEQYTNNYFGLHEELNKLFDRPVDLVTERTLTNPYFIESVNETRQLIYEV